MSETKLSFENRLKRLEQIVAKMESGNLPLEEALKLFNEGNTLLKSLQEELSAAEMEITKITGENPDKKE
ncbi:MAG: exodeoxyribonuclease VII small subunit [Bacilli bacterium]